MFGTLFSLVIILPWLLSFILLCLLRTVFSLVCCIVEHFDDILHVLHTINVAFDIIAITETWVTGPVKDLFNIPNYSLLLSLM